MGEVFRAVDTRLGRAVAIKTAREQFSARFEREARALSSLNHPYICTLYDVGHEIGRKGGLARAKALTPEERRKSALKASKAAAASRKKKAKERKQKQR